MQFKSNEFGIEESMLLELNYFIHGNNEMVGYQIEHIKLVRKYAMLLNKKLHAQLSNRKLGYIALAHDLFKERSLDPDAEEDVTWKGHIIPQDTTRYVRTNLEVLEKFGLDEYFNTDMQYHALAAGIFLYNEFGIKDPEILYPVFFHSCQIISVYETLPTRIKRSVDIIMLADKLSSNWLKINMREVPVRIDLDLAVFGQDGLEFNFSLGLFLARVISQGKSTESESKNATKYYFDRLTKMNPLIPKHYSVKKLGGAEIWPKRKSRAFRTD